MEPTAIFYPMLALVICTFALGGRLFILRSRALRTREVSLSFFRSFSKGTQPEPLAVAQRAYGNLLEAPPLFHVVCVLIIVTRHVDSVAVTLAWAYVLARIVQAAIHLGYNNVLHRGLAHGVSMGLLLALWIRLAFQIS